MAEAASREARRLLDEARALVDARLEVWAERMAREVPGQLGEALAYALRSPGKRRRALRSC
ncbi:MAG: hypothetical protein V9E87_14400 [Gemmatimonadales bacterium]